MIPTSVLKSFFDWAKTLRHEYGLEVADEEFLDYLRELFQLEPITKPYQEYFYRHFDDFFEDQQTLTSFTQALATKLEQLTTSSQSFSEPEKSTEDQTAKSVVVKPSQTEKPSASEVTQSQPNQAQQTPASSTPSLKPIKKVIPNTTTQNASRSRQQTNDGGRKISVVKRSEVTHSDNRERNRSYHGNEQVAVLQPYQQHYMGLVSPPPPPPPPTMVTAGASLAPPPPPPPFQHGHPTELSANAPAFLPPGNAAQGGSHDQIYEVVISRIPNDVTVQAVEGFLYPFNNLIRVNSIDHSTAVAEFADYVSAASVISFKGAICGNRFIQARWGRPINNEPPRAHSQPKPRHPPRDNHHHGTGTAYHQPTAFVQPYPPKKPPTPRVTQDELDAATLSLTNQENLKSTMTKMRVTLLKKAIDSKKSGDTEVYQQTMKQLDNCVSRLSDLDKTITRLQKDIERMNKALAPQPSQIPTSTQTSAE